MRKRIPKNKIIRVGDLVKVKTPQLFVRCGYPLCFEDMRHYVMENYNRQISDFLLSLKIPRTDRSCLNASREYEKVRDALAYFELRKQNFGGNRRSIHTEENIYYKDKVFKVVEINFVKTGFYSPGFGGDWYEDYEPAVLDKQETHKILTICRENEMISFDLKSLPKIEARCVEKVIVPNPDAFGREPKKKVFPDTYGTWWD